MAKRKTYNGWAVQMRRNGKACLAKRREFAKNKRGHDDEVDRVRVFKSRKIAVVARNYLMRKYPMMDLRVVKVWMSVTVSDDDARKALS